jgi:hypothetical protein
MPPGAGHGCGPFDQFVCPAGTMCLPIGTCQLTGAACAAIGSPCPGGAAGDLCQQEPTTCFSAEPVCAADSYGRLPVAIADLPGAAPTFLRALAMRRPGGTTPMASAAVGALEHLRTRLAGMARRRGALIIATDGLPAGCGNQDIPVIADALYLARTTTPPVPTYVIGVLDAVDLDLGRTALGQLARAGGTAMPFILSPDQDLTAKLVAALGQIRDALPCEFAIPEEKRGSIDLDKVNLHFRAGATDEDVPFVGSADHCDPTRGGWHYDAGTPPTRVVACETTCGRFRSEGMGKVELRFGCKTVVIQ